MNKQAFVFFLHIQTQELNCASQKSSDNTENDTCTPDKSDLATQSQNLYDNAGVKESYISSHDECSPLDLKPEPVQEASHVNEGILSIS